MKLRLLLTGLALAATHPASGLAALSFPTPPTVGSFGSVVLNGQSQTVTASVGNWSVNDTSTLSLTGWRVTVAATRFQTAGGTTLPLSSMTYAGPNMTAGSGQLQVLYPVVLASRAVPAALDLSADGSSSIVVVRALANTGSGLWNFTQGASDLRLTIGPMAAAGTYSSTVTFTLSSGPF